MNNYNVNVIFRMALLSIYTSVIAACMWMPVARDDLSVLGNDVFSNLIRDAYLEKPPMSKKHPGLVAAHTGYGRIDKSKANEIARRIMSGRDAKDVVDLFSREGGICTQLLQTAPLACEVIRKWKIKNVGAPMDTSNWSDPAVKLLFNFKLSSVDVIVDVELDIVNATQYKQIKG